MAEYIQMITTVEDRKDAERIAEVLVQKKLAACVQIVGPIFSTYWWEGEIEKSEEWLCFIKTEKHLCDTIEKTIKDNHPYDVPEIVGFPLVQGSKEYFSWLSQELKPD